MILNTVAAVGLFVEAVKNRTVTAIETVAETVKEIVKRTLTPWKSIKLDGTKPEGLIKAIEEKKGAKEKNFVSDYARDLMGKPAYVLAENPEQVDLVVLTLRDLGFTSGQRTDAFMTKEFCANWSTKYLDGYAIELCALEDGPQLRLQYQDQPKGEILFMAMERITVSGGYPHVFSVGRRGGGKRWLDTYWAYEHYVWYLDYRFVFRLRKLPLPSVT